jgi:hypothetical protein
MIETFHSQLIWKCMRTCPYVVVGLHRGGFRRGWLDVECGTHDAVSERKSSQPADKGASS